MKKNYFLTILLTLFFSVLGFSQVSYSGNGNTGFGGPVGAATMTINDDGTTITCTFTKGSGNFNDTMAMYISTGATGRNIIDSNVNDTGDSNRRAISNTGSGSLTLPAGFQATHAVAINTVFGGLWSIPATGTIGANGLLFVASVGKPAAVTTASFSFTFTWAQIGLTNTDKFDFVITYGNPNDGGNANMYSSNEAFGAGISATNPGLNAMTFTASKSYPNTWTGTTNNNWATATNWTEGVPTTTHNVYIPKVANQPTAVSAVTINKAVINSGASVIAQSTFAGTITYNVHVADTNWHLISSPVAGEQYDDTWVTSNAIASGSITPANRAIATYQNGALDATTGPWTYFQTGGAATTFGAGVGYSLLRTGAGDYSYTGTFPTTAVSPAISQNFSNWNLIGNPYPSYIDVAAFIAANSANIPLLYRFIGVFDGTAFQYLTTGYIHPGQAFFINSNVASGTAVITETMQSHQTGITFYKSATPSINLTLSNSAGDKKTEINYLDGKTTGLDPGFDIGMFDGVPSNLRIYTHLISNNEGIALARQALPSTNLESLVVPVGVKAAAGKEITFSAETLNLPTGIKVFLEDRTTNTFTRLDEANSNYKVTLADAANGTGRFYLHTSQKALSVDTNVILNSVSIYKKDASTLRIVGLQQGKANVKIFNILGKQMINYSFKTTGVQDISLPQLATGIYIVELTTKVGKLNRKIVLQ